MLKPLLSRLSTCPLVGPEEDDGRAHQESDIADTDGEERLEGGAAVGVPLPTSARSA